MDNHVKEFFFFSPGETEAAPELDGLNICSLPMASVCLLITTAVWHQVPGEARTTQRL